MAKWEGTEKRQKANQLEVGLKGRECVRGNLVVYSRPRLDDAKGPKYGNGGDLV